MSKKLLNESQVRRFMKLATIEPLANGFVQRSGNVLYEQDEMEDELADPVGDDAMPPGGPEEPADMMAPEDMASPGGPADFDVEELVVAIADAIEGVTGVEVDVEGEGGEEEGDMAPVDDMGGMEDDALAAGDMGMEEEPMMERRLRAYVNSRIRKVMAKALLEGAGSDAYDQPGAYKKEDDEEVQEEGHQHMSGGEDMLNKGTNSNKDFESDDNRQSSAGKHHMGGGAAKNPASHTAGGNGLPLEEQITDDLLERVTRQVAAKLMAASKKRRK